MLKWIIMRMARFDHIFFKLMSFVNIAKKREGKQNNYGPPPRRI